MTISHHRSRLPRRAQPSGGGGRAKKGEGKEGEDGKEGGGSGGKRKREKGDGDKRAALLGRLADDDDEGFGGDGFAQAPMAAADSEEIVTSFAHCEGGPPTPLDEPLSLEVSRDDAENTPRSCRDRAEHPPTSCAGARLADDGARAGDAPNCGDVTPRARARRRA